MALQFSASAGGSLIAAFEGVLGESPLLEGFTGAQPANCAASDSGTKLLSITLPADWLQSVTATTYARLGEWLGTVIATGKLGHFRLKTSGGTTHIQGTVTREGGGGDFIFDNPHLTAGHTVTVGTFKIVVSVAASTTISGATFTCSAAVRGPLANEITGAVVELEDSMADLKDEITDALTELESLT